MKYLTKNIVMKNIIAWNMNLKKSLLELIRTRSIDIN